MYSPAAAERTAPDLSCDGEFFIPGSGAAKIGLAPTRLGQTPRSLSHRSGADLSAQERARFAEEWLTAVSLGWEHVMHLLESCCSDPDTKQMLRTLASD